jgi:DMSO/TMAO reductase YedYZ molybdopterin-dependent catalytic subunit
MSRAQRRGPAGASYDPRTMTVTYEQLQLAARNHGMPLEALAHAITPIGLHYLLIHYDIPSVDAVSWRLTVDGEVQRPLSLALEDLRARFAVEVASTMECAGNGRVALSPPVDSQPWLNEAVGTGAWRGVRLRDVLDEAGVRDSAVDVLFTGLDRGVEEEIEQSYQRSLPLDEALRDEVLLAYDLNGSPLPPQHGFPLRLLVPGWYGMTSVKWLERITVLERPFEGFQMAKRYRLQRDEDDPGTPLTRMFPRALAVPPGIPDFHSRERFVDAGPCLLRGRAWSGWAQISHVGVSVDGGKTWAEAQIERDVDSPWAWCAWSYGWQASPGRHELCFRARDEAGNEQPLEGEWNVGGYRNNAVHRVVANVASASRPLG